MPVRQSRVVAEDRIGKHFRGHFLGPTRALHQQSGARGRMLDAEFLTGKASLKERIVFSEIMHRSRQAGAAFKTNCPPP